MSGAAVINAIASFLVSFCSALYLIPFMRRIAFRLNFLDRPDGDLKKHRKPTPYLGGVAIYCAVLVSLILFFPIDSKIFFFIGGSSILLITGLIDDWEPLLPHQKLFGQIIAALCFMRGGLYFKALFLSSCTQPMVFLWVFFAFLWILTVINAYNLVDVMDGLATSIALSSSVTYFVIALFVQDYSVLQVMAAVMGALSSFLIYNFPPATIYLGDAGSLFIGGIMAIVPLMIPWGMFSWHGYAAPVVITAIPLLEIGTLILIRTYLRIPFYRGSPHHFSHFLKSKSWSVKQILFFTLLSLLTLDALAISYLCSLFLLKTLIFLMAVFVTTWYIMILRGESLN